MKSPRETIEYIAQHLAKQNMIAMDVDGTCQYPWGRKELNISFIGPFSLEQRAQIKPMRWSDG